MLLYNIPGNAVNALTPALVSRLAELDHVVAVKESSGDWNNYYATYLAVHDRLRVFCGPSSVFGVPAVRLGADGIDRLLSQHVGAGRARPLPRRRATASIERRAELQAMGRSSPTSAPPAAARSIRRPRRPWT